MTFTDVAFSTIGGICGYYLGHTTPFMDVAATYSPTGLLTSTVYTPVPFVIFLLTMTGIIGGAVLSRLTQKNLERTR